MNGLMTLVSILRDDWESEAYGQLSRDISASESTIVDVLGHGREGG